MDRLGEERKSGLFAVPLDIANPSACCSWPWVDGTMEQREMLVRIGRSRTTPDEPPSSAVGDMRFLLAARSHERPGARSGGRVGLCRIARTGVTEVFPSDRQPGDVVEHCQLRLAQVGRGHTRIADDLFADLGEHVLVAAGGI